MSISSSRLLCVSCAMTLLAASPLALAQVTLNLASAPPPQQTDCVVTTDANGLSLAGNSTILQATGVSYSGTGCGGNSVFNAQLSVPSSTVAGSPVNVTWSASAAATQCVYAGSAPAGGSLGAAWIFGATACAGTSCAAPHTTAVVPTIGGSYNLAIVCTNSSGIAQSTLNAAPPPLPPQPANFALSADPSPVTNVPFNVSWAVTGANSCTGSATLGGAAVALAGWTDTLTTISPRSVTAVQAGTYTLGLACQNASGTTNSQALNVTVGVPVGACNGPAGLTRQTTGTVKYVMSAGQATRDLTSWAEIWGHSTPTDVTVPWPGRSSSPPIITMNRTSYIAAQFTVPQNVSPTLAGFIQRTTYSYGIDMTAAISATCGDFSPPNPQCRSTIPTADFPHWQTNPSGNQCPLPPGVYYLNIKATDPNQASTTCPQGSPACPMGTQLNFNQ